MELHAEGGLVGDEFHLVQLHLGEEGIDDILEDDVSCTALILDGNVVYLPIRAEHVL